jgi:spore maturation protein CgeB
MRGNGNGGVPRDFSLPEIRHDGTIVTMLTIAFLHQGFLVQREVIGALKRLCGVRVIVIDVADFPIAEQAEEACAILAEKKCSMLFTINDWGLDFDGIIAHYIAKSAMIHINWCVDDPFFMEIIHDRPIKAAPNRLDFVSNRAYVQPLREKGMDAHFLALASDPSLFHPLNGPGVYERDLCFVGNSYRKQLDDLCSPYGPFMEDLTGFMSTLLTCYENDTLLDIEAHVAEEMASIRLPLSLPRRKAVFLVKHFISFLFRKRIVCSLAKKYDDFMVFGDECWLCDLAREKVSMAVGYYQNLNETYGRTKINVDINRVVITEGLTQRVFDCGAGAHFVITSNKPVIGEFFAPSGKNREAVVFDGDRHLKELIDYFLTHEDERRAIAERAHRRVLNEHTYDHRIRRIFGILSKKMGTQGKV